MIVIPQKKVKIPKKQVDTGVDLEDVDAENIFYPGCSRAPKDSDADVVCKPVMKKGDKKFTYQKPLKYKLLTNDEGKIIADKKDGSAPDFLESKTDKWVDKNILR